jgi:negative regulator of flagellin synthesis FlgM
MPIEINGFTRAPVTGAGDGSAVKNKRGEEAARSGERSPATGGDSVSLTDAAARLHELEQSLAGMSEADAQRVEEIRRAIADGSYRVAPERVAQKILDFEGSLVTKVK